MLACLRGTVCRPLIIPLPTGLLGVRWLILVLTTLLGVGWQLAVLRLVETAVPRKTFQRKCTGEPAAASLRLWCGVGDRRGGRFPLRFCRLGLLGSGRHLLRLRLRHDGRQLNGCGFANLDRDADDRRLVDRSGFFRIRVAAVTGKTGDLWGRVLDLGARRRVRQVAQTVQFVGALERGV